MPGKNFVNRTGYDLSLLLTVRRGSTPGHEMPTPVHAVVERDRSRFVAYGDDADPYLDAIAVNAVENGGFVAEQQFVFTRGSTIDDQFNTHDTVAVSMHDGGLVLAFSNSG